LPILATITRNEADRDEDSSMGMNVNLTPQLEDLVRRKVASGMYTSASEVVREALRLMEEQDQLRAARLAQLRNDIQEGLDSGASEPWDHEATKRLARAALIPRRGRDGLMARVLRRYAAWAPGYAAAHGARPRRTRPRDPEFPVRPVSRLLPADR
jgi:antitoxin ParD1/3/4